MADELKNKIYIVVAVVSLVITAAGGWTAVIIGRSDITLNTQVNNEQTGVLRVHSDSLATLKSKAEVHQAESIAIQRSIEVLQRQVAEDVKAGTDRYVEILKRLPKRGE